jgi:SAM-dependent methyltransferase
MHELRVLEAPTPGLDRLEATFRAASPVFRNTVANLKAAFGTEWTLLVDETVTRLFPDDSALAAAVEGYSRFSLEAVRLQLRFEKELAYPQKSYADVTKSVYANESYMRSCYLPGLLLSHDLWPHHFRQRRYFERAFVDDLHRSGTERFYDIGVGTGLYSRLALVGAPRAHGTGFDISPTSRAFAEKHVRAFGAGDRYRIELGDVIECPAPAVDRLVCVEVLEHLENPLLLLAALRAMLRRGGRAFVTAAINAPNIDHIYLYRNSEEVRAQLVEAGFAVEQYFVGLAGPPRHRGAPVPEVAAFVVT